MNRRKLAAVPVELLDDSWLSMRKDLIDNNLICTAKMILIDVPVLMIGFYSADEFIRKGINYPLYRAFISKRNYQCEIQDFTETKQNWTQKTINDMLWERFRSRVYYANKFKIMFRTSVEESLVLKYFRITNEEKLESVISNFEKERKKRQRIKNAKTYLDEKRLSLTVPRLPGDFSKFIGEIVGQVNFIFYEREHVGCCSSCNEIVDARGIKNKSYGICPNCGKQVQWLSRKIYNSKEFHCNAAIIQKVLDGWVYRRFRIHKTSYSSGVNNYLNVSEEERIFFDGSQYQTFCKLHNKISEEYEFSLDDQGSMKNKINNSKAILYTKNIPQIFRGSDYEYSAIEFFDQEIGVLNYLSFYSKNKQIEKLIKCGARKVAKEIAGRYYQNLKEQSIYEMIGLNKVDSKEFIKINGGLEMLGDIKKLRQNNVKFTYEQYLDLKSYYKDSFRDLIELCKYDTLHKIHKYLLIQAHGRSSTKYIDTLILYRDYISIAKQMQEDLSNSFVLYPKNLKVRHDEWMLKHKQSKNEKLYHRFRVSQEKFLSYEIENKNLLLKIPLCAAELELEGQALHHCVGTYIEQVASKKCNIAFIRTKKNPNESFYTLEFRNGEVVQCRGRNNCAKTVEVTNFVKAFEKHMKVVSEVRFKKCM